MGDRFLKDSVGWGLILWLVGYVLGFVFFAFVPADVIGWVIMPVGVAVTLWVLLKKISGSTFTYYFFMALIWTLIAVVFDHVFVVMALNTGDAYYKFDVYAYYALLLLLPLAVGWGKSLAVKSGD